MSKQVVEYSIHTLMHWRCSMTAAEFYEQSPEFRQLIAEWVRCRRCPYGLADLLAENELYGPANASHWAATEPGRLYSFEFSGESCGPFPVSTNKLIEGSFTPERERGQREIPYGKWAWIATRYLIKAWEYPGIENLFSDDWISAILMLLDSNKHTKEFKPLMSMNYREVRAHG